MTETTTGVGSLPLEERARRFFELDDELLKDPWTLYRDMRDQQPVMRVGPAVVVTRYDDIKNVFRDTENFSNKRYTGTRVTERRAALSSSEVERYDYLIHLDVNHIGQNDPPDHTRLRRFVNQAFSSRAVEAMRERVTAIGNSLLDEIDESGDDPFDLATLSWRLPFLVVCSMLQVPDADVSTFRSWALEIRRGLGTNYDNLDAAYEATKNLEEYVLDLIKGRRHETSEAGDDLVSNLLATDVGGTVLSDEELVTMFAVMLTTGNANDMISNAVIALEEWPDQRALLKENPDLLRGAIEEFLRYCPSALGVHRVAVADGEIAGFPVRAGETVRLVVASGNRDPRKFTEPDRLDVTRKDARQHLDFGYGIHTCLGQWLARLDIEVGLTLLYERYPDLRIAAPFSYRKEYQFRGPQQLLIATS
ncbi:cytochrome P450 [Aeromicrobium sp. YIM 150415]|uniref:cytochrome P450 n=1 Tax=Aeromicrobium sp. YIM 150415 TaxID=2803912 RepID=UPI001966662D|nr:cytochrome P450 [Aeromicrobium sp. YIM 150415]MBM9464066.1 cytochrome P450 [Aeromicrobium sp. YIM 150415]